MRVIVTRPGPQAGKWVSALRAAGHDALALPLIEIGPPFHPQAVAEAWQRVDSLDALMFVSANAVTHFFALRPDAVAAPMPGGKARFWATGPGTVAALRAAGIAPEQIDAPDADAGQFDSEALWKACAGRVTPGWQVLIVRGNSAAVGDADADRGVGRDWLAARLAEKGAAVAFVVAYERRAPVLTVNALALAQVASADGSVWVFSSSEAVANLCAVATGVQWGHARAVATHARIAQAARDAGFGVVHVCSPGLTDMLASIESLA